MSPEASFSFSSRSESDCSVYRNSDGAGGSAVPLSVISPDDHGLTALLSLCPSLSLLCLCAEGGGVLSPIQGQRSVLYYIQ